MLLGMASRCPYAGILISFTRRDHVAADRCEVTAEKDGTRTIHCVDPTHCPVIKAKDTTDR
jgi:hypothetical protein